MSCDTASVVGRTANETETERLKIEHIALIEVLFQNPAKGTGKKKERDISVRIATVPVENLTGYLTNEKLDSYHYVNLLRKTHCYMLKMQVRKCTKKQKDSYVG